MKKKIFSLTAVLALGALSAYSQGFINFANSGTTLVVTNGGSGNGSAGLTTSSGIKVALFYQPDPNGSTAPVALNGGAQGNWEMVATLANIAPLAGRFNGGNVQTGTDVAPAGNVWLEVVSWNANATSYANALANSGFIGYSGVWSQGTGDGGSVAAQSILAPPAGAGNFAGLTLNPVPEPTTIALGGLGAAALLLFRRRK